MGRSAFTYKLIVKKEVARVSGDNWYLFEKLIDIDDVDNSGNGMFTITYDQLQNEINELKELKEKDAIDDTFYIEAIAFYNSFINNINTETMEINVIVF